MPHIVRSYDTELSALKNLLIEILKLNTQQLNSLHSTISTKDKALADQIVANDIKINDLDKEVVNLSLDIFSLRNPVAQDLRFVFSSSHISRNAERIGDYTKNITRKYMEMTHNDLVEMKIMEMIHIATEMMHYTTDALVADSIEGIEEAMLHDKKIDVIYSSLAESILKEIVVVPEKIVSLHNYLLISRYLERIGDHIVNICGYLIYAKTGSFSSE